MNPDLCECQTQCLFHSFSAQTNTRVRMSLAQDSPETAAVAPFHCLQRCYGKDSLRDCGPNDRPAPRHVQGFKAHSLPFTFTTHEISTGLRQGRTACLFESSYTRDRKAME